MPAPTAWGRAGQLLLTNGLDEGILGISVAALRRRSARPKPSSSFHASTCIPRAPTRRAGASSRYRQGDDFEFPLRRRARRADLTRGSCS